jgi:hypothetical protein
MFAVDLSRLDARLDSGCDERKYGAARRSSASSVRSKRHRGSRSGGRRRLGEEVERTEAQRMADIGWVEWGDELIWVVGFTSGSAPYGLRVSDFAPADFKAMGPHVAAVGDAKLTNTQSSIDEADDRLRGDDVPFEAQCSATGRASKA